MMNAFRLRFLAAALMFAGIAATLSPLYAQQAASNNPAVATDGATLIHGNYCGAGNRPGAPPIDALDLACMNHDACTPASGIPNCDCNERLRDEAAAVARDPKQAPELRSLASLTAAAATVMVCKPMLNAATPPKPAAPVPTAAAPAAAAPVATTAPINPPPADVPAAAPATPPVVASSSETTTVPPPTAPASSAPMSIVPPVAAEAAPATAEPRSRSLP